MSDEKSIEIAKLREEIGDLYEQLEELRLYSKSLHDDPNIRTAEDDVKALQRTNASRIMELLLTNIDKWIALQEPGTEEYQTGLIMKICARRFKTSFANEDEERIMILKEVLNDMKPFAETPKGFLPYMNIVSVLFESSKDASVLKNAFDSFKKFTEKTKEPIWHYTNIFSGELPSVATSDAHKNFLYNNLCFDMSWQLKQEGNMKEAAKLAINGLRHLQGLHYPVWKYNRLACMIDLTNCFIGAFNFKQLDHCLAGLMFQLVQYRRSLPESKRKAVSKLQAEVASSFTLWGAFIVYFSIEQIISGETLAMNNDSYEELEWFQEPGVEVYAHQFPIDLVDSTKEIKHIAKRVHKWDKRTAELYRDGGSHEWIPGANDFVVKMDKQLDNLDIF